MNYEKEIEILLKKLPHKLQVKYALSCAESVFHLVKDEDKPIVRKSLDTTALWLVDKASADKVCASAATYAAAARAAVSAVYFAAKVKDNASKHYYEELVLMINDLTELDKLIYDINDLKLGVN